MNFLRDINDSIRLVMQESSPGRLELLTDRVSVSMATYTDNHTGTHFIYFELLNFPRYLMMKIREVLEKRRRLHQNFLATEEIKQDEKKPRFLCF